MTREDIIRMAREAGWSGIYTQWAEPTGKPDWSPFKESLTVPVTMEQIERFAALVAAAERERRAFEIAECYRCGWDSGAKAEREKIAQSWDELHDKYMADPLRRQMMLSYEMVANMIRGREMNLREAAQQSLEALEDPWKAGAEGVADAIIALRAALAETAMQRLTDEQQEMEKTHTNVDNEYTPVKPVAWRWPTHNGYAYSETHSAGEGGQPLYTAPPKRTPLTDEEMGVALGFGEYTTASTKATLLNISRSIERAHGIGDEE